MIAPYFTNLFVRIIVDMPNIVDLDMGYESDCLSRFWGAFFDAPLSGGGLSSSGLFLKQAFVFTSV
jgi:hypothetical protein